MLRKLATRPAGVALIALVFAASVAAQSPIRRGAIGRSASAPPSTDSKPIPEKDATERIAGPPPVLITRCLSSVCIGDDIEKISLARVTWIALPFVKENIDRYTRAPNIMRYQRDPKTGQSVKTAAPRNQYIPSFLTPGLSGSSGVKADIAISQSFRGLTDNDVIRLALHVGTGGVGPSEATRHQIFNANDPGPDGIAITPESLALLRKPTAVCGTIPVLGMFRSESGYDTTVLLLPEDGKYVVVGIHRFYEFKVPDNTTPEQRSSLYSNMYRQLVDQLNDTFGNYFVAAAKNPYYAGAPLMAVGTVVSDSEAVAYLNSGEVKEPVFSLLKRSFAKFDKNLQPLSGIEQRNGKLFGLNDQVASNSVVHSFQQNQNYYFLDWQQVSSVLNQQLSSAAACSVSVNKVSIN